MKEKPRLLKAPVVVREAPVAYRARKDKAGLVRAVVDGLGGPGSDTLIHALRAGLDFRELEDLRELVDLPMDRLVVHLGIPRATLHRRRIAGRLDPAESDRVLRYARLVALAVATLESLEAARAWLGSPQIGLGGLSPLTYAETEVGAREVETLLGRIEYGVHG